MVFTELDKIDHSETVITFLSWIKQNENLLLDKTVTSVTVTSLLYIRIRK